MRILKSYYLFLFVGLMVISCQKDSLDPVQVVDEPSTDFEVPVVPDEIASLMSDDDLAKFQAGPGEEYLQMPEFANGRRSRGHWYPVLMKLGYHLQFGPFVGESCDAPTPCFGPTGPTGAPGCEDPANYIGIMGMTYAEGYWFSNKVHSEYYPVFCLPDYAGYGSGFYQVNDDQLWLEAENGPFQVDEEGNSMFVRRGNYSPEHSTGSFSGAIGWEVMISYTAAENSPQDDGTGYSDVIIFGWVFK
jgi:hypothetical protein